MNDRLTQAQLQKLVAEVGRVQNRRQDELDAAQVREILQELNLDPELLPDAMVQLRRREALEVEQRRRQWILTGAIAAIVILTTGSIAFLQYQQYTLSRIGVQSDQVILQTDPARPISRIASPADLTYQITLTQAPVGQPLDLRCDWIEPSGRVVKQNRYTTKIITTDIWLTRCRYTLDASATPGLWTVKLLQGDRPLSDATFEVQ
jgi:hypothetical protein